MSKSYKWHKVADDLSELHFSAEGLCAIEVDGKKICISLFKDQLYATSAKCPHAGGNLSHGYIDSTGNIVCPIHRYKFALQTGKNVTGEGYYLKTYLIENRANGIFVGIEESGIFNWLK